MSCSFRRAIANASGRDIQRSSDGTMDDGVRTNAGKNKRLNVASSANSSADGELPFNIRLNS